MQFNTPPSPHPVHAAAPGRAAPHVAATQLRRSLLVFHVGGQPHAVASCMVAQILPMAELHCPPGIPEVLAGYLNLAAELVPVIRLHQLLDLPAAPLRLWTPLIVLRGQAGHLALLVESVDRTLMIDADSLLPLPEGQASNGCAEGAIRIEDETVLLLSPERLLLKQEDRAIAHWRQRIQQRIDDAEGVPS